MKTSSTYAPPSTWAVAWAAGWTLSIGVIWVGSALHQEWLIGLGLIYFVCTPWYAHKHQ